MQAIDVMKEKVFLDLEVIFQQYAFFLREKLLVSILGARDEALSWPPFFTRGICFIVLSANYDPSSLVRGKRSINLALQAENTLYLQKLDSIRTRT